MDALDAEAMAILNGEAEATEPAAANGSEAASDEPAEETETPAGDEDTPAEEEQEDESPDEAPDDTEAAESEETDSVSLQDLFEDIPSNEDILKTHKRMAPETKEFLLEVADKARASTTALNRVGGEEGIAILEPVHNLLSKAERAPEDRQEALASMLKTNAQATTEMLVEGALELLFSPEKNNPVFREVAKAGDYVLSQRFGEGMTAEKIEKYALLEKGGIIDLENDIKLLDGDQSPLYQSQAETITEQKNEIEELKRLVANPDEITRQSQTTTNALKELDAEIEKRAEEKISKVCERMRWSPDWALTKTALDSIRAELKQDPDYLEAVAFVKQNGKFDPADRNINLRVHAVQNKLTARFGERTVAISNDLKAHSQTSRNAIQKEKAKETKPAATTLVKESSSQFVNAPKGFEDKVKEIYNKWPVA